MQRTSSANKQCMQQCFFLLFFHIAGCFVLEIRDSTYCTEALERMVSVPRCLLYYPLEHTHTCLEDFFGVILRSYGRLVATAVPYYYTCSRPEATTAMCDPRNGTHRVRIFLWYLLAGGNEIKIFFFQVQCFVFFIPKDISSVQSFRLPVVSVSEADSTNNSISEFIQLLYSITRHNKKRKKIGTRSIFCNK